MSADRVKQLVDDLQRALDDGEHNCDVYVEDMGDMKEVSFYVDTSAFGEDEPVATLTVAPVQNE